MYEGGWRGVKGLGSWLLNGESEVDWYCNEVSGCGYRCACDVAGYRYENEAVRYPFAVNAANSVWHRCLVQVHFALGLPEVSAWLRLVDIPSTGLDKNPFHMGYPKGWLVKHVRDLKGCEHDGENAREYEDVWGPENDVFVHLEVYRFEVVAA